MGKQMITKKIETLNKAQQLQLLHNAGITSIGQLHELLLNQDAVCSEIIADSSREHLYASTISFQMTTENGQQFTMQKDVHIATTNVSSFRLNLAIGLVVVAFILMLLVVSGVVK